MDNELLKAKKEMNGLKDQISKNERLLDEGRRDIVNTKQKLTGKVFCLFVPRNYNYSFLVILRSRFNYSGIPITRETGQLGKRDRDNSSSYGMLGISLCQYQGILKGLCSVNV